MFKVSNEDNVVLVSLLSTFNLFSHPVQMFILLTLNIKLPVGLVVTVLILQNVDEKVNSNIKFMVKNCCH